MAIYWNTGPKAGTVEHEGRVLEADARNHHVTSEMWGAGRYALVWLDEGRPEEILLDPWDADAHQSWHADAEADARPDVVLAHQEYERKVSLIGATAMRINLYGRKFEPGHAVAVFKGRKVPLGEGYTVLNLYANGFGPLADLRGPGGESYARVDPGNLQWVRPTDYCRGEVACRRCLGEWGSPQEAGMIASHLPDALCMDCRLEALSKGGGRLVLPYWSKSPHYSWDLTTPLGPLGLEMARAALGDCRDQLPWAALCDWLEDRDEDGEAATLRAVLFGGAKGPPVRARDLVLGPWVPTLDQWHFRYARCEVTGFPPSDLGDAVTAQACYCFLPARQDPHLVSVKAWYHKKGEGPELGGKKVGGPLLRAIKSKLPPLPEKE